MTNPTTLNERALILSHTARMGMALDARPDHPRTAEYARQLRIYRGQWAALTPDEQAEAAAVVETFDDMTPDIVAATIATLEE